MQQVYEKSIRESMDDLLRLTTNFEEVLKSLSSKSVISEDELKTILEKDSDIDKMSQFYWTISRKNDEAYEHLIDTLKSTGNESAVEKLCPIIVPEPSTEDQEESNKVDVTVESHGHSEHKEDHEGMALASEIEKEFERIQSEVDNEPIIVPEPEQEEVQSQEVDMMSNVVSSAPEEEQKFEEESDVRVEITAPTESEPEPELEEAEVQVEKDVELEQVTEIAQEHQNGFHSENEEKEVKASVSVTEEPEVLQPPSPSSPKKQVSFGEPEPTVTPTPKEFVLNDDASESERADSESPTRSIVALNREKFEKPLPNGEAPKVKYSFAKKGGVAATAKTEEEPKESTVKNLRNFFQKLGSVDKEDAVQTRPAGVRTGAANRRTMI